MAASCKLDNHPLVKDIDDMLRAKKKYGEIREYILGMEEEVPDRYLISRHKSHLGLAMAKAASETSTDSDTDSEGMPDIRQIAYDSLRLFAKKIREEPDKVSTRDLIPFIQLLLRELQVENSQNVLEEALDQINAAENS